MRVFGVVLCAWMTAPAFAGTAPGKPVPIDFDRDIMPILARACVECHGPHKASGGLQMTSAEKLVRGGFYGKPVVAGSAKDSYLMQRLLGHGGEDQMPIKGDPLSAQDIGLIRRWIDEGAAFVPDKTQPFTPKPAGLSRLTNEQYANSVRFLFGQNIKIPTDLEPDMVISGSAVVGAARFGMSPRATEQFGQAAFDLARQAAADPAWRARWVPCQDEKTTSRSTRTGPEEHQWCLADFISRFGRLVWRRPLTDEERSRYVFLGRETMQRQGTIHRTIEMMVAALLQSPQFLYHVETGIPDPEDARRRKLTDFELAARLSFFLLGTTPNETLLDAAQAAAFSDPARLRDTANQMLDSPAARQAVRSFFAELFGLERLTHVVKSRPAFKDRRSDTLAAAFKAETLGLIDSVVFDEKRDFREIFDSRATFVNEELARYYGTSGAAGASGNRTGVLGHAAFLALHARPTRRGKFIRERLLCQAVPPPPPGVSNKLPEHKGDAPKSLRARLEEHRTAVQCKGCHKAMDPMGYAFEHFDDAGLWRPTEGGLPIDSSGNLDGIEFKTAAEFAGLLRHSNRIGVCMARNMFRFALGTLEAEGDEQLIEEFDAALRANGYRFRSLLLAVVTSRGFRYLSVPKS